MHQLIAAIAWSLPFAAGLPASTSRPINYTSIAQNETAKGAESNHQATPALPKRNPAVVTLGVQQNNETSDVVLLPSINSQDADTTPATNSSAVPMVFTLGPVDGFDSVSPSPALETTSTTSTTTSSTPATSFTPFTGFTVTQHMPIFFKTTTSTTESYYITSTYVKYITTGPKHELAAYPFNPWDHEPGTTTVYDLWWNPDTTHTMTIPPQLPTDDYTVVIQTPPPYSDWAYSRSWAKQPLHTVDEPLPTEARKRAFVLEEDDENEDVASAQMPLAPTSEVARETSQEPTLWKRSTRTQSRGPYPLTVVTYNEQHTTRTSTYGDCWAPEKMGSAVAGRAISSHTSESSHTVTTTSAAVSTRTLQVPIVDGVAPKKPTSTVSSATTTTTTGIAETTTVNIPIVDDSPTVSSATA